MAGRRPVDDGAAARIFHLVAAAIHRFRHTVPMQHLDIGSVEPHTILGRGVDSLSAAGRRCTRRPQAAALVGAVGLTHALGAAASAAASSTAIRLAALSAAFRFPTTAASFSHATTVIPLAAALAATFPFGTSLAAVPLAPVSAAFSCVALAAATSLAAALVAAFPFAATAAAPNALAAVSRLPAILCESCVDLEERRQPTWP